MREVATGLDATDRRIVEALRQSARRTFADIGAEVSLSASAVKRRVDRLEASGVIRGYTAMVDNALLGRPLEAFVEVTFAGDTRVGTIEGIAADVPEVQAVFTIAGDPDALAWIEAVDVDDLKRLIDLIRSNRSVVGTKTLIVLGSSIRYPSIAPADPSASGE